MVVMLGSWLEQRQCAVAWYRSMIHCCCVSFYLKFDMKKISKLLKVRGLQDIRLKWINFFKKGPSRSVLNVLETNSTLF